MAYYLAKEEFEFLHQKLEQAIQSLHTFKANSPLLTKDIKNADLDFEVHRKDFTKLLHCKFVYLG